MSLDSLQPNAFQQLTKRDDLARVLAGIDAALDAGLDPVKVNCVVMRGVNDHEIVDLAAFGREKGVGVRFIEFMPLDAQGEWTADQVVQRVGDPRAHRRGVPARPTCPSQGGSSHDHVEPAERFRYADGIGDVGVIASVTEPFCEQCDRIRITAEGKLRTCLFALDEFDLRAILRATRPTTRSTTGSRPRSSGRSAPSGPATASARSTSCAPTAR